MTGDALPDAAYLAALARLPGAGPARLAVVLDGRTPAQAWRSIARGEPGKPLGDSIRADVWQRWHRAAAAIDPAAELEQTRRTGVGVVDRASPAYPTALTHDPEPPAVLFFTGDITSLEHRRVAIVGTRRCTRYGVELAHELGGLLAANGVTVVSGLASGIDTAAHTGALAAAGAPPAAVVASGLDVPYPRENRELWLQVATAGVIVSEAPLGVAPERWRFPARNRIIAGLSEIVVVVESHRTGGSLYTAGAAVDRDIPVLAVPGSVRSAASAGTNRLLADGCHPLCHPGEVLELLDLVASPAVSVHHEPPALDADAILVIDAIGWQPTTLESVARAADMDPVHAAGVLDRLVDAGCVVPRGRWFERTIHAPRAAS